MEKTFHPGELIFKKGDLSDYAYIIRLGQVEILRDFPEKPLRIALLNPGDVFGEMGLIDERPRLLTARATEETHLLTVTRNNFVDLLKNNPEEALKYLRMFFERLRVMNLRVTEEDASEDFSKAPSQKFSVIIFPDSNLTEKILPPDGFVLENQAFLVGRKSKHQEDPLEVNHLVLEDVPPYNLSRNHFSIERKTDAVIVRDRGSFVGTIVNGKTIGGHHNQASIELQKGENTIIAGTHHSPFRFRVLINQ